MVDLYIHTLVSESKEVAVDPYQDVNGDWVIPGDDGNPPLTISQPCKAVANTGPSKVPSQDGEKIDYSFMINLPFDAIEVPFGADVVINDENGNQIGKGTVKRFFRNSMKAFLWV